MTSPTTSTPQASIPPPLLELEFLKANLGHEFGDEMFEVGRSDRDQALEDLGRGLPIVLLDGEGKPLPIWSARYQFCVVFVYILGFLGL
jgi:hypothetical protein